jgi:hypothetical protein
VTAVWEAPPSEVGVGVADAEEDEEDTGAV